MPRRHSDDGEAVEEESSCDCGKCFICCGGARDECPDVDKEGPCCDPPCSFPCQRNCDEEGFYNCCACPGPNAYGIIFCDKRFSTLARLIRRAGLKEVLESADPITLFAPTNDAFEELSDEQWDALLSNRELLRTVLLYHMLPQPHVLVALTRVQNKQWETLAGAGRYVVVKWVVDPTIKVVVVDALNNESTVLQHDIHACTSIIQVIDEVLLPFLITEPAPVPT